MMSIHRLFGKTGFAFFPLGLGTIWFGRQWPPDNPEYSYPSSTEIHEHLALAYETMGNNDGVVMVDTAAAYGDGESRIGNFLRDNPKYASLSFIATKWGEDFDAKQGVSSVDHSLANLHSSFERSLRRLGRVDLLYLHKSTSSVLHDKSVIDAMVLMRKQGSVQLLGASISDASVLEAAVREKLLDQFDVIQTPAPILFDRLDLITVLYEAGKAIVINSPIRKSGQKDPMLCYAELLKMSQVSMILTGTRTHLKDTIGYVNGV